MIYSKPRHVATLLAVAASSALPMLADAQEMSDVTNLNLTLRFLPSTPDFSFSSTCAYSNTTAALTFTTSTTPAKSHCFNLAELFTGNATSGFVNQSRPSVWQESGLYWSTLNAETFDPQANYSSILYREAEYGQEPGSYAAKRVNLYGGLDCTERDPNDDKGLLDWYGLNCWSGVEGDCGSLPHGVASFAVIPGTERDGKCMVYAELGARGWGWGLEAFEGGGECRCGGRSGQLVGFVGDGVSKL